MRIVSLGSMCLRIHRSPHSSQSQLQSHSMKRDGLMPVHLRNARVKLFEPLFPAVVRPPSIRNYDSWATLSAYQGLALC